MTYKIKVKKKVVKGLGKLPLKVIQLFYLLADDLKRSGPEQPEWKNYSKLGNDKYHCHLNYRYVACWTCHNDEIEIEVYYVGSRENAPY